MTNTTTIALDAPLLTLDQVASLLAVSRNTVYRMVDRGALAVYRVSRSLRFNIGDIANLRERRQAQHRYVRPED